MPLLKLQRGRDMSSECVPIGTIVEILHRIFVVSIATGEAETSPNLNTHPPSFYLLGKDDALMTIGRLLSKQ
ncbi:hypothetical protein LINPERHAP2_LOCUS38785 [Linum perenne]